MTLQRVCFIIHIPDDLISEYLKIFLISIFQGAERGHNFCFGSLGVFLCLAMSKSYNSRLRSVYSFLDNVLKWDWDWENIQYFGVHCMLLSKNNFPIMAAKLHSDNTETQIKTKFCSLSWHIRKLIRPKRQWHCNVNITILNLYE